MKSRIRIGAGALVTVLVAVAPARAQVGENLGLLNPNLATEEQLAAVPGLDAEAVGALTEARPFLRMADLHAVVAEHVDAEGHAAVYRAMFVPIDLNDVTDEEILLIPGVGNRMQHEFEEYRPYTSMAQFRREIRKYVDEDEVERLARYVEIR